MSTTSDTAPPAGPQLESEVGVVDHDRSCVRCSYNLRGLPIQGNCPECGNPVRDSLKGILLQFASPEYLAKIGKGLSFILNGILLMVATFVGAFVVMATSGPAAVHSLIWQGIQLVSSIVIFVGYWMYTEPDPGFVGTETPGSARNVARVAAAASVVVLVLTTALEELGVISSGPGGLTAGSFLSMLLGLVSLAAWAVQFFAIMRYTRWVSGRVPDAYIVKRTKTYMWLLPVLNTVGIAILIGPLMALIMYWNLLDRLRKHLKAIRATGQPAALPKMV